MAYYYNPNHRNGANLFSKIFFGKYDAPNETLRWTIECADGKHSIGLRLGSDVRMGKSIYVDGDYVTNIIYKGRKFLPEDTYDFDCYGEQVKFVFYRNKVYLVHKGIIHGTQKEYKPDRKFPLFIRILLSVVALASIVAAFIISGSMGVPKVIYVMIFASLMQIAIAGIVFNVGGNPFYTTLEKLMLIFGLLLGTWAIACFIPLLVFKALQM